MCSSDLITSPNLCAVGPNNETAAIPKKNPSVAPHKPYERFPLILILSITIVLYDYYRISDLKEKLIVIYDPDRNS